MTTGLTHRQLYGAGLHLDGVRHGAGRDEGHAEQRAGVGVGQRVGAAGEVGWGGKGRQGGSCRPACRCCGATEGSGVGGKQGASGRQCDDAGWSFGSRPKAFANCVPQWNTRCAPAWYAQSDAWGLVQICLVLLPSSRVPTRRASRCQPCRLHGSRTYGGTQQGASWHDSTSWARPMQTCATYPPRFMFFGTSLMTGRTTPGAMAAGTTISRRSSSGAVGEGEVPATCVAARASCHVHMMTWAHGAWQGKST